MEPGNVSLVCQILIDQRHEVMAEGKISTFFLHKVSFAGSMLPAGLFEIHKPLTPTNGKLAICIGGFDLSRRNGVFYSGVYIQGSDIIVQGYNNNGTTIEMNGFVHVLEI